MKHEIIIGGFGGQGVLSMGMLLTRAGMLEGREVTFLPSYGAEQRGGTANCSVVIADSPIYSPIVSRATAFLALNEPSLRAFGGHVAPGGIMVVNSSLVAPGKAPDGVTRIDVPASGIAAELGEERVANMVLLGAYLGRSRAVSLDSVMVSLAEVLPERHHHLLPVNRQALERGAELAG